MNGYFDLLFHFPFLHVLLRFTIALRNCTNLKKKLHKHVHIFNWTICIVLDDHSDSLIQKGMGQIFCPNPDLPKRNVASMAKRSAIFWT